MNFLSQNEKALRMFQENNDISVMMFYHQLSAKGM